MKKPPPSKLNLPINIKYMATKTYGNSPVNISDAS